MMNEKTASPGDGPQRARVYLRAVKRTDTGRGFCAITLFLIKMESASQLAAPVGTMILIMKQK